MGITISLCMIVKDEEKNLANCLSSVCDVVDEINIVDTGSTDGTVAIARQFTDRVYYFEWIDDFAAARNFSFSKATKDYILWLDADDILTPENTEKLRALKETLPDNVDYVAMPYHCSHDQDGNVLTEQMRERLLKRTNNYKWKGEIHETLDLSGTDWASDVFVTHNHAQLNEAAPSSCLRNLRILEKVMKKGDPSWRTVYYYGLTLYEAGKMDEALSVFHRLFQMPDEGRATGLDAYLAAYKIYLMKGDHQTAYNLLADHEHLFYDKSEYYCALGDHFMHILKTYEKACMCYTQALSCKGFDRPDFYSGRNEQFYYYIPLHSLGMLFIQLKMYKEAITYMEKALAFYPSNDELRLLIEKMKQLTTLFAHSNA